MTKKHYIDELHWLGWEICELIMNKQTKIDTFNILKKIKEILGDDFGKANYQELLLKKGKIK